MKIGGLITNYEAWDLTLQSVQGFLIHCPGALTRVVVVDDCSVSKPAEDTAWNHPLIKVHQNERNVGYAASVNRGFKFLGDCDIVILLDCDSRLLMNPIPEIERKFRANECLGALAMREDMPGGSRIAGEEEPVLVEFLLGQKFASIFGRWFPTMRRRFIAHSCSLVVRRQAFDSVGGFDETFDFLDADVDFSLGILNQGWLIQPAPELRCFHQGSGSPQSTRKRVARYHRNRFILLKKHGAIGNESMVKFVLAARHLAEVAALSLTYLARPSERPGIRDKILGRIQLLRQVWGAYA